MITVHVQEMGDKAIVPREELEELVRAAQQQERVELVHRREELPTYGLMKLVQEGGALDWLADPGEDVYTIADLKVRYR